MSKHRSPKARPILAQRPIRATETANLPQVGQSIAVLDVTTGEWFTARVADDTNDRAEILETGDEKALPGRIWLPLR